MKVFLIYSQFRIGCISNSKTRQNLAGTSSCKKNGCGKVCCIFFNPTIFGLIIPRIRRYNIISEAPL